jgi:hypothetical protein
MYAAPRSRDSAEVNVRLFDCASSVKTRSEYDSRKGNGGTPGRVDGSTAINRKERWSGKNPRQFAGSGFSGSREEYRAAEQGTETDK